MNLHDSRCKFSFNLFLKHLEMMKIQFYKMKHQETITIQLFKYKQKNGRNFV